MPTPIEYAEIIDAQMKRDDLSDRDVLILVLARAYLAPQPQPRERRARAAQPSSEGTNA